MPFTTIAEDDTNVAVAASVREGRPFSWSAVLAGSLAATAVTFFLLALGSGVGLTLVSARGANSGAAFLTLGAIYFVAAQAFGFGVGGHLAGRLMGPAFENAKEEEFQSGAHGLVTWAVTVVATSVLLLLSAMTLGSAASGGALAASAANFGAQYSPSQTLTPDVTGYWVDLLFRPVEQTQSSVSVKRYAQAQPNTATDATPDNEPADTDQTTTEPNQPSATGAPSDSFLPESRPRPMSTGPTLVPGAQIPPNTRDIAADRAEVRRILGFGLVNGGWLTREDRNQVVRLVSQEVNLTPGMAAHRVNDVEQRIHNDEVQTAETARKVLRNASLWTAFALLFGGIVATLAAVSARWEDDRVSLGLRR